MINNGTGMINVNYYYNNKYNYHLYRFILLTFIEYIINKVTGMFNDNYFTIII